jgi:sodium-independent sulfate anion transporter 11
MSGSKATAYLNHKARSFFDTASDERRKQTASLEQIARETINQTYHEDDPSVAEWFRELVPSSAGVAQYVSELFPSAQWVRRYNLQWFIGDLIAGTSSTDFKSHWFCLTCIGITVGLVVVPQAMAYALLARLPPAFGLYTTFTGACIYWIFGTSKDIVIGVSASRSA